jgi:hypothetical protein
MYIYIYIYINSLSCFFDSPPMIDPTTVPEEEAEATQKSSSA